MISFSSPRSPNSSPPTFSPWARSRERLVGVARVGQVELGVVHVGDGAKGGDVSRHVARGVCFAGNAGVRRSQGRGHTKVPVELAFVDHVGQFGTAAFHIWRSKGTKHCLPSKDLVLLSRHRNSLV